MLAGAPDRLARRGPNDPITPVDAVGRRPVCAPRRSPTPTWRRPATTRNRLQLDPMGDQPGYGGDTDLAYTGFSIGLGMGVFPELVSPT